MSKMMSRSFLKSMSQLTKFHSIHLPKWRKDTKIRLKRCVESLDVVINPCSLADRAFGLDRTFDI